MELPPETSIISCSVTLYASRGRVTNRITPAGETSNNRIVRHHTVPAFPLSRESYGRPECWFGRGGCQIPPARLPTAVTMTFRQPAARGPSRLVQGEIHVFQ